MQLCLPPLSHGHYSIELNERMNEWCATKLPLLHLFIVYSKFLRCIVKCCKIEIFLNGFWFFKSFLPFFHIYFLFFAFFQFFFFFLFHFFPFCRCFSNFSFFVFPLFSTFLIFSTFFSLSHFIFPNLFLSFSLFFSIFLSFHLFNPFSLFLSSIHSVFSSVSINLLLLFLIVAPDFPPKNPAAVRHHLIFFHQQKPLNFFQLYKIA